MVYIKDGKRHAVRNIHVCEVIELDQGTDIVLVNNQVIPLEEDYITVCKTVFDGDEVNLTFRVNKSFVV